jgi:twitching motility protein PilJ
MSDAGAPASQINLANRQIVLADRMSRRVTEIRPVATRRKAAARLRGVRAGAAGLKERRGKSA